MDRGRRVLGLIAARGGSQGIPRKNLRDLAGKPMIAWTVEAARACRSIDRLILSSDDPEIIAVAQEWGCEAPFVRPPELATSEARSIDVIHHAMDQVGEGFDYLVLLQPTSPLRIAADIDDCVEACERSGAPACISVTPDPHSLGVLVTMNEGGRLARLVDIPAGGHRRQDMPAGYVINGAVYVARWEWLRRAASFLGEGTIGRVMPRERSIDIDDPFDLEIAAFLLSRR